MSKEVMMEVTDMNQCVKHTPQLAYLRGWNSFSYPAEAETGPKGGKISHTQELCCEGFFVFF